MPEPAGTRVPTPLGEARVVTYPAQDRYATVLLSHGAGGGLDAVDLVTAARLLPAGGVEVWLVEQPWRLAGRRLAPAPSRLDEAFTAVVRHRPPPAPFLVGGRSAGARVACRTGSELGAAGVLAFSFPLHPPGRPERSRLAELAGVGLPTLVVQGGRDAFGSADAVRRAVETSGPAAAVSVLEVPGADHGFAVRQRDGGAAARDSGLADALQRALAWIRAAVPAAGAGNT